MRWYQPLLYLWASPTTLFGLSVLPIVLWQRGTVHIVAGVVEISGGIVTRLLTSHMPWIGSAAAMTLGHVVWGVDQACLDRTRAHERVHVRQYERWGPFFIPAYFISGWLIARRGGNPYYDNPFEREAYDKAP